MKQTLIDYILGVTQKYELRVSFKVSVPLWDKTDSSFFHGNPVSVQLSLMIILFWRISNDLFLLGVSNSGDIFGGVP